jgi:hypothetical protein
VAGERHLCLKTFDGRAVSGAVVLESERGILLRTADGNVLVEWRDIESSETAAAPSEVASPSRVRLGISGGLGVGGVSEASLSRGGVWLPGEVAFIVDAPFGPLGFRVSVPLAAGPVQNRGSRFKGFAGVDAQIRLNFSSNVASGLGLQAGLEVSAYARQWSCTFVFGPTLTPVSVRFGQHELSLEGGVAFVPSSDRWVFGGGTGIVRYAHFF